jgi:hypothetical protein
MPDCLPCRAFFSVVIRLATQGMRGLQTIGALILAAAFLGACATAKPPPPKVNLAGFPPAFRDGYADGCQSAKPFAAKHRDDARYARDTQYASGWRDGYDICRKRSSP